MSKLGALSLVTGTSLFLLLLIYYNFSIPLMLIDAVKGGAILLSLALIGLGLLLFWI